MEPILQPAKQERSRDTLERILRATRALLKTEPFDSISIRRIIDKAGTSIGSFYARFRDKNALLPVLYAEYEKTLHQRIGMLEKKASAAETLDQLARLIVSHFVDMYGEIPNLSRALFEYATRAPQSAESKGISTRRKKQYSFLLDELLRFRGQIRRNDPERVVELGLYFMVVACRNRLLYPLAPQTRTLKITQKELKQELARLLTGYLREN